MAPAVGTGITATQYGAGMLLVDYDNDGRADFLGQDATTFTWWVHPSTGTTFSSSPAYSLPSGNLWNEFPADLSGDGFPELVGIAGSEWQTHKHLSALPDV